MNIDETSRRASPLPRHGLCLVGCGKKKKAEPSPAPAVPTPTPNELFEVRLSPENFYTYFDYKEYRADVRDENTSDINSSTIAYGFALKPQSPPQTTPRTGTP